MDVKTNKEFTQLSEDINKTVDTLKGYIKKESERIQRDLEFANLVQSSALPKLYPPYSNHNQFDIYASMNPAKIVGGDFYDFYLLDDKKLVIEIADVSDKGIAAAMFMMEAKSIIKSYIINGSSPKKALELSNNSLCENNKANMFLTVWLGILDLQTGMLTYANAGHNQPLIKKEKNIFEYLTTETDFILSGISNTQYNEYSIKLNKGDVLFLYTDGITEANNSVGTFYGEERLQNLINNLYTENKELKDLCKNIKLSVDEFSSGISQSDDITMLCLRYK